MWAGLLAGARSVMLQSLTGLDTQAHTPGRMPIATLRRQLLRIPGRLIRHARGLTLRLRPADTTLPTALARLRSLPAPTGQPSPTPTSKDPETPTPHRRPRHGHRQPDQPHPDQPHPSKITDLMADLGQTGYALVGLT